MPNDFEGKFVLRVWPENLSGGGPYKITKFWALGTNNFTVTRKLGPVSDCSNITCFNKVPSAKFSRTPIDKTPHLERVV
jgi:hypothetical protein